MEADPNRLAQILANLLNNAAKYTPSGGRIRLAADVRGAEVEITVQDNGIGIPPGMFDRIFEMFTQVDHPQENGHSGLGIGLTLVKSLVGLHGGAVEVHSDGIGQGSRFTVRMPILEVASMAEEPPLPEAEKAAGAQAKIRVLVVDDNRAAADMLSTLVEMLGNEVRTVYRGQEAVETSREFHPDLVLLDIGMPGMDGYEAARCIRRQPWGRGITLVALTGWGQNEDKERTRDAGFDHHLVKPADLAVLRQLFDAAGSRQS